MSGERDQTRVYETEDGDDLTFAQIAFVSAKDPDVAVEETDAGFLVNGQEYVSIEAE